METMENEMTVPQIQPLKSEKFLEAVSKYMELFRDKNNYDSIFQGHLKKLDMVGAGYGHWLQKLLGYLVDCYSLGHHSRETCILDIGCGTGEFVVRMNLLGYKAKGVDLHEKHLELARILAEENSLPHSTFVLNKKRSLPFDDNSFDIVTMFSVLEHMDDNTLEWILPELRRVCRGVLYILVPNRLKPTDDHTGLHFVSYLPRWLASSYINLRRRKYQYFISESGAWDVYHRSLGRVVSLFKRYGFDMNFPPDDVIYPSLATCPPVHRIGKNLKIGGHRFFLGLPLPQKMLLRLGYPKQVFYPYLNLVFIKQR